MNIEGLVGELRLTPKGRVICVRPPWTSKSNACVVQLTNSFGIPSQVKNDGYTYFLETDIALEILGSLPRKYTSDATKAQLLIYYAENDGFPDWIYDQ
jgi:hypothetical protein